MSDLRLALHALVEHPPAAPPSIDELAARGAGFTRRRRVQRATAGALAGLCALAGVATASLESSTPGVTVAADGPASAGYIAEHPGGYVATGTWQLTIRRQGQVIVLASTTSPACADSGMIQPGDEVRGLISGPESSLRVGESFACPR